MRLTFWPAAAQMASITARAEGSHPIAVVGLILLISSATVMLLGRELFDFWLGLILLGLGWNLGFLGGTTMLTKSQKREEKAKLQAANDFIIVSGVAIATFFSGAILAAFGWVAVNWLIAALTLLALIYAIIGFVWERRQGQRTSMGLDQTNPTQ